MLSRLLSVSGLLALILAIGFMYGPGPDGATVFRWDRLLIGIGVAVVLFVVAARTHRS